MCCPPCFASVLVPCASLIDPPLKPYETTTTLLPLCRYPRRLDRLGLCVFPKGDHGYHPQYESMHGIFVGHGPGFKSGYIGPRIQNIHLYEMMCKIMDIIPASNDGNPSITTTFLQD